MTPRKTPIRHKVKSHKREGKPIGSYRRGSGARRNASRKVVGRFKVSSSVIYEGGHELDNVSNKEVRGIEDRSTKGEQLKIDLSKILGVPVKVCKAFKYNGFDATDFIGGFYHPSTKTILIGPKANSITIRHEKVHAEQHKRLGDEFEKISDEVPRPEEYWKLEREARKLAEVEDSIFESKIDVALDKYYHNQFED